MKNNKIVILHVFSDGLIFSKEADKYDNIENIENRYYFHSPKKDFKLTYINDERVKIINDFKEYVGYFSSPEIDVILFYGLPYHYYYLFDYIDDSKFVIWWAWGYDIYYSQGKYSPLIPLSEMYKPLTKEYKASHFKQVSTIHRFFSRIYHFPKQIIKEIKTTSIKPKKSQKEILTRIDSFYAPLDIEYDLMKEAHSSFMAKRNPRLSLGVLPPFNYYNKPENVLVNHSLTYSDNHLDVFSCLKSIELKSGRKYIIPINYGIDGFDGNPDNLIKESPLKEEQVLWLTKVLPNKDYSILLDSVSHAVFGALRQQALGNIYGCLRRGAKVFLYKDSVLYKELKRKGFILYTIDNDLNSDSLSICLSEQDAKINYEIFSNSLLNNTSTKYYDFLVKALEEKKSK